MAGKSQNRSSQKDKSPKQNGKCGSDSLPDEIALRDEILELKRQMMVLKKTNEQNLVKLRKYEDEAKRKDRQIEQLMDPTKNSDIRKILSTKGAAILMNLKDQNNALIQMILEKDLQIKRLIGEIKTSKLYATSRRTEPYRMEIARLRQLLIKSQELLKEATESPPKRSICIGGTPVLEITSSSDQSSPRELEELRFTIQSLETHMKYSNELLGKKNQEIMILTEQLNSARNACFCKTCNKKQSYDFDLESTKYDWFDSEKMIEDATKEEKISPGSKSVASEPKPEEIKPRRPSSSAELLELFERTMMISKDRKTRNKAPKSAPAGSVRAQNSVEVTPRRGSAPVALAQMSPEESAETQEPVSTEEPTDTGSRSATLSTSEDQSRRRSKSLFHDLATATFEESDAKTSPSEEPGKVKEKWKTVVKKIRKSQRRKRSDFGNKKECAEKPAISKTPNKKKKGSKTSTEVSGNDSETEALETYEFELMEKKIENDQIEIEDVVKSGTEDVSSPKIRQIVEEAVSARQKLEQVSRRSSLLLEEEVSRRPSTRPEEQTIPRRHSTKPVDSSRRSSTSTNKSSSSHKSDSSSSRNKESRRKLIRSKNVTEIPVPLRRTKISEKKEPELLNEQEMEALAASLTVEEPKPIPNLDEITIYQTEKPETDTQQIKQEISNISSRFSPEIQKELQSLYENITSYEEMEKKGKSLREVYRQSVDSSFDSENSSSTRQEAKVVEVEVEINQVGMGSVESCRSQEEHSETKLVRKEGGDDVLRCFADDDDDDVVVFC